MARPAWFRVRGYSHFDVPVKEAFALGLGPTQVIEHKWTPLIHYVKIEKRYKFKDRKTVAKERPIMFASHRDACVLSKYSSELVGLLEHWYAAHQLTDTVIAYRSLGLSNYDFARRVQDFVRSHPSLTIMCFDVTGFFDNLDHRRLKERLKWVLGTPEIRADWFAVLKAITRYRYVNLDDLKKHTHLAKRLKGKRRHPLATIREIKDLGVPINKNTNAVGIPQGTPISASISNLYMTEIDLVLSAEARKRGALYQRYSDDILIACHPTAANKLESLVDNTLKSWGLDLQKAKTERVTLAGASTLTFQYLGYQLGHVDARLRNKSLSRQWRTARRALRKAESVGTKAIAAGKSKQIYTRKLNLRLTDAGARNFLAYAERSSAVLESKGLKRQIKRLRRHVQDGILRLKRGP